MILQTRQCGNSCRSRFTFSCLVFIVGVIVNISVSFLYSTTNRPSPFAHALNLDTQTPWLKQREVQWNLPNEKKVSRQAIHHHLSQLMIRHLQTHSNAIDVFNYFPSSQGRMMGDFDELNDLLSGLVIALPDMYVNAGLVLGSRLRMWTSNLKCTDIRIRDIIVDHNRRNDNRNVDVTIKILGLGIDCSLDWRYKWSIFGGKGRAQVYTTDNNAATTITFTSENFNNHPPNGSSVSNCNANVEIDDMDFQGGITGSIINTFEKSLRGTVEKEINKVACDELGSLGTTFLSSILSTLEKLLEQYLQPLSPEYADPLYAEKMLPSNLDLINLSSMVDDNGNWFSVLLNQFEKYLRSPLTDSKTDNESGMDLGINKLLRSTLLDEEGAFVLSDLSTVIFDGHDLLTETTMTLTQLKIFGLDSFSEFDPLLSPGNFTLSNHFFWDHIDIELDVLLEMKPSSKDDSLIDVGTDPEVIENIRVRIGVNDVDVDLYFLLAVKQEEVTMIELGQLLHTSDIFPCVLKAIHAIKLTGLSTTVSDIDPPSLEGFISGGIDNVITNSANAAFEMYESAIIKALPNAFETTLRDFVNILFSKMTGNDGSNCPPYDSIGGREEMVDFRDLFLEPEESKQFGGNGDKRYGDVGSLILKVLEDELLSPDTNGYIMLNDVIVKPLTQAQSGNEGELRMKTDLVSVIPTFQEGTFASILGDSVAFRFYNAKLRNIDTFHAPVQVLSPRTSEPFLLNNSMNIGSLLDSFEEYNRHLTSSNDIDISGDISLIITGEDSPFKMANNISITITVPKVAFGVEIETFIKTERLMTYPLKDITNTQCLLALLDNYDIMGHSYEEALVFLFDLPSIELEVECVSCSSLGLKSLPDIIQIDGTMDHIKNGIDNIINQYMTGEWLHANLRSLVSQAPFQCPHDPAYDATFSPDNAPFPLSFNRENTEFLVYCSVMLSQAIVAIVAISHDSENMVQTHEELPSTTSSIDLNELKEVLDPLILQLGEDKDGNLAINDQVRSFLLDEQGVLTMTLSPGSSAVSVVEVRVEGLDTFQSFNVLNITSSQHMTNQIELKSLSFEFDFDLHVNDDSEHQTMTLKFGAQDIELSFGATIGIIKESIGQTTLGSLLDFTNAISCILSKMEVAHLTEFVVSANTVNPIEIDGFVFDVWSDATETSVTALWDEYGDTIIDSLPNLFNITVRKAINNLLGTIIENGPVVECSNIKGSGSSFVSLSDLLFNETEAISVGGTGGLPYGKMVGKIVSFIEREAFRINQTDGTSLINDFLIAPVTKKISGSPGLLTFPEVLQQKSRIDIGALQADLEIKISDAQFQNLDTLGLPLDLFKASSHDTFNSTATIGVGGRPLRLSTQFQISFETDAEKLDNLLEIRLAIHNATLQTATVLSLSEQSFLNFPIEDLGNFYCWLSLIPAPTLDNKGIRLQGVDQTIGFKEIAAIASSMLLEVECVSCTSPAFEELAYLMSTPEAVLDITSNINYLIDFLTNTLGEGIFQTILDRALQIAPHQCPHSGAYNPDMMIPNYEKFDPPPKVYDSIGFIIVVGCVLGGLVVFIALILSFLKCIGRKRQKKWVEQLSHAELYSLEKIRRAKMQRLLKMNNNSTSMISSPAIPLLVRVFIPLIIFANIGFFMSGHLSLGASVDMYVNIGGQPFVVEKVFIFSMAESVMDMWEAGAKELAILVALFSGVWPYTKQLTTLFLWISPPSWVTVSRRGSILEWLDTLGKWSFIDIFVLIISVVCFRVSAKSPDLSYLPESFYALNLLVTPCWGLYSNMTAQLISQVSSHFIIYYHRKIISSFDDLEGLEYARSQENEDSGTLSTHIFGSSSSSIKGYFLRPSLRSMVYALAFVSSGCLISGCIWSAYSLESYGLVGLMIEIGQEFSQAVSEYNLLAVLQVMINQAFFTGTLTDFLGLGSLCIILVATVLFVPIIQIYLTAKRWYGANWNKRERNRSFVAIEVLEAWNYLEVYLFSIIVACWQLSNISSFLVNDYCKGFDDVFATMAFYGVVPATDAQCFLVTAQVEKGTWMLICASVIMLFLKHFVGSATKQQEGELHQEEVLSQVLDTQTLPVFESRYQLQLEMERYDVPLRPLQFTDYYRWFLRRIELLSGTKLDETFDLGDKSDDSDVL